MKIHQIGSRFLQIFAIGMLASCLPLAKATPYASCITNDAGTIKFYLNESGGNVTVTYEDGSTNASYNGVTTGTNLASGSYMFAMGTNESYAISVFKAGSGVTALASNTIQNATTYGGVHGLYVLGNLRGVDINKDPNSPYFGRLYISRGNPGLIYDFNADGSFVRSNDFGGVWSANADSYSPYRIAVAPDNYLMVADRSQAGAAVWRVTPNLSTNTLFLGPIGVSAGTAASVHGEIASRPLVIGALTNDGTATMITIDGDLPNSAPYSLMFYTNITTNALPWENPPDLIGPEIGLGIVELNNVYPGLTQGPNGYIYASEQRANWAIPDMYVFDSTGTNELWNSLYGPTSDYFVTDAGDGVQGLIDSAVSPDGKYLVGLAIDNHLVICSLTNGIPDVSTIYSVVPPSYAFNARGVCWDAADNIYTISSGEALLQEWTLGVTATAVTTGNVTNGPANFQITYPPTSVAVSTTNAVISQANSYGNSTSSSFTITRTGGTAGALTVFFSLSGTAKGGSSYPATYTASATSSVIIPDGETSAVVNVSAVEDGIPRPTTTLTLTLLSAPNYGVSTRMASMDILNTAPDELIPSVSASSMYNAFSNDYVSIKITRWGDSNATAFTASSFSLAGTALAGTDYTTPTAVTFNPGDLTHISYIHPLINGQMMAHTNNLTYTGNKTIVVGLNDGAGYTGATNIATLTIIDSANPTAAVLFYDPLTNADDATNWNITAADGNMPTVSPDYYVDFGYDLTANTRDPGGSFGVTMPFPPNGAPTALRVTVNKGGATENTGVNLYLTNMVFSGNYAVRFNMNITEASSGGTTEGALFGINHNGMETNWWSGSGIIGTSYNWASDGIWYWVCTDGGAALGDYITFTGNGGTLPNSPQNGWQELDVENYSATFANAFKTNIFTVPSGPGLVANEPPDLASSPNDYSSWSDVEIKQVNGVVTWSIDKTPISVYTNTTVFTNGMVMLGYEDPFNSTGAGDAAVYYSNLRVVRLTPPLISETGYNSAAGTFVFDFTTTDGDLTTSSFVVQGSTIVNGTYTDISGATITQLSNGAFQATVPASGSIHFYRIRQK